MITHQLKNILVTDGSNKVNVKKGTLRIQQHFIDVTNMDSGGHAEYIPGQKTWSIDLESPLPLWAQMSPCLQFQAGRHAGPCIADGDYILGGMGALTTE